MNISKIYQEFSGNFLACPGNKCQINCCQQAQKKGIAIFPDEVIFLIKTYGKDLPVEIIYQPYSYTGFIITNCSVQKICQLQNHRPLICRCYPIQPIYIKHNKWKILTDNKCPKHRTIDENFYDLAINYLYKSLHWYQSCIWKKYQTHRLLKKINKIKKSSHKT